MMRCGIKPFLEGVDCLYFRQFSFRVVEKGRVSGRLSRKGLGSKGLRRAMKKIYGNGASGDIFLRSGLLTMHWAARLDPKSGLRVPPKSEKGP